MTPLLAAAPQYAAWVTLAPRHLLFAALMAALLATALATALGRSRPKGDLFLLGAALFFPLLIATILLLNTAAPTPALHVEALFPYP